MIERHPIHQLRDGCFVVLSIRTINWFDPVGKVEKTVFMKERFRQLFPFFLRELVRNITGWRKASTKGKERGRIAIHIHCVGVVRSRIIIISCLPFSTFHRAYDA